jgi:predicted MFS family arabinose efflux permease
VRSARRASDREAPPADPGLRRAALATALVFAVNGFLLAAWVARLPATRDRLGASVAELGLVLLAPGFGSLLSMPFGGRLCRRFGSRAVVAVTTVAGSAALVLLAVVPTLALLAMALFAWGSCYGSWDVAMNVHGSAVEQRAGREWMPRYHACWSVGGIAGAGLGALAAHAGVGLAPHFAAVAVLCVVLVFVALRSFVEDRAAPAQSAGAVGPAAVGPAAAEPDPPDHGAPEREGSPARDGAPAAVHSPRPNRSRLHSPRPNRSRLLSPRLLLVGVVTLCATTLEGAAADWLALFLTDEREATASLAAAGYAVFAVAMAGGRFSGTVVAERLGRDGAVRVGGLVSLAGVLLTVTGPGLASAYLGAVLWALGVCLVFPAAVSAGGEEPERPQDAIAAVTTIGYGGFLIGPPLIGLLAEQVGLGRALLVLLVLAAGIAVLAPAVRSRRPRAARTPAAP